MTRPFELGRPRLVPFCSRFHLPPRSEKWHSRMISGSDDETVRIWDALTGKLPHKLKGYMNWVRSTAISLDGTWVVSGSYDRTIRIWDVQTGASLHELEGHTSSLSSVIISEDGTRVLSGGSRYHWSYICCYVSQVQKEQRRKRRDRGHSQGQTQISLDGK